MRITELDLSPSAHAEPHDGMKGRLILAEQPPEYDSCVGRVHTDSGGRELCPSDCWRSLWAAVG